MERVAEFVEHFADAVPALAHLPGPSPEGRRLLVARRRAAAAADPRGHARRGGVPRAARDPRDLPPPPRRSRACSTGAASATRSTTCPAESDTGMFGGNSNWRGPVWFPMNLVILRGLLQLHRYYGDRLKVECPTGSGREMNLLEVALEIGRRLTTTFTEDEHGRRPVFGGHREVPDRPALARPAALPRVLPRRQRRRHRREPPDRLDRHRGAALPARRRLRVEPGRPPASPSDGSRRAPASPPDRLRDQHRGLAAAARPRARAPLALDEVPAAEWDALAALPVDAVWLMGVWQRSPAGLRIALADPALDAANRAALPDLRAGGRDRLALLRARLRRRRALRRSGGAGRGARAARRPGPGLILDYVPNHVAPDHPWTDLAPRVPADRHRGGPRAPPRGVPAHRGRRGRPRAATPTSPRGPTWCSSTRSRRPCARPSPRP